MEFSLSVKWTAGEVSVYRAQSALAFSPLFKKKKRQPRQTYFISLSAPPRCLLCDDWLWEYSGVSLRHLCTPVRARGIGETWFHPRLTIHPSPPPLAGSFPCHRLSRPESLSLPVLSQVLPTSATPALHRISFLGVARCFWLSRGSSVRV